MKTLKTFLEKHNACEDGFEFAKDLTLEEFLETCQRGDWILWLFARTNPKSLKELTLAKAHCANTVRHLMIDERSLNAVDVALAFGEGLATREELADAANAAYAAANAAYAAADAANAADDAANAAAFAASNAAYAADDAAYAAAFAASNAAYAAADAANAAAFAASNAANAADDAAYAAFAASNAAFAAADDANANAASAAASASAKKQNQKQTANICRKFLPIEIWDQSQF
jgi:hypothetical protein